jgi:hypothetical protein
LSLLNEYQQTDATRAHPSGEAMGFITNEWIHQEVRTGNYTVAEVRLVASSPTSEFSRRHELVMRLKAEKAGSHDYQVVHFNASDLLHFFVCSLREVGPGLRAAMLSAMLGQMSDDELALGLDVEISRRRPLETTG